MASAVSLEYLQSLFNQPGGLPTLLPATDPTNPGKISPAQLPAGALDSFKGEFADEEALTSAYLTAGMTDFAFNDDTTSFWYWNTELTAWVNQQITASAYAQLSAQAQAVVPYVIIPG